jgi:hypothetical protein
VGKTSARALEQCQGRVAVTANCGHERWLGLEEVRAYCRIVTTLKQTIGTQEEIDTLYPGVEAETITLSKISLLEDP